MLDFNLSHIKLKVNDTYKKDEQITTEYEPSNDEDVISKAYLDEKVFKTEGRI